MTIDRLAYRVTEFADALGVSRTVAYELIARGDVASIRVGRGSVRVPVESAREYIARQLAERTPTEAV